MAAKKNTSPAKDRVTDLSYFWTDLNFVPDDWKQSKVWAAQALFHAKLNSTVFLDPKRARDYRKLDNLEIDRQEYVNMIDPVTPMGGGGRADYFASDFQDIPIATHLDNIVNAKLDKIALVNKLQVNEIDKFAKTQRQIDKDKIIFQREFIKLINMVNQDMGFPEMKDGENPYEYVKKLSKDTEEKGEGGAVDDVTKIIEQIRLKIKDQESFALYERYVYKGDIERAFEMGMEHYLINQNKWRIKSQFFNEDLKKFNKACGRWYTDETTGRGVVEYIAPENLFTSPFRDKDGNDIMYWYFEKFIPFSDFNKQFGLTLTDEQLKEVFLLNKNNSGNIGLDWTSTPSRKRNNATIKIGYMSILTQEASVFSEQYVNDRNPSWERKPLSWEPDNESDVVKQKIYNVWHSFYYIPPPGERLNNTNNTQADWAWQSQFIFNLQKDKDMYRYGVDSRYAKSQLVIYNEPKPSFTDIKESFMPKIRTAWHKFQNSLVQDFSGMVFDLDLLTGILNATDEANNKNPNDPNQPSGGNGVNAGMEAWRMLRQGGSSFMKFRDKNGNLVVQDPNKLFVKVDSGHLEKAEKYLQFILQQYEMMKMALAQSDITEGQAPKPRTAVAGINASIEAANNAMWFIEKPVREFVIMFGERCLQSILCMVKEKKKYANGKRWDEFEDVVGLANALMIEGIEDIEPENLGITVSLEDISAMQDKIESIASQLAVNNQLGWAAVGLVVDTAKINYKYAYALMMLFMKDKEEENAAKEELAHQRQMELGQQQLQIAQTLQGQKTQGKVAEINQQTQGDAMLQDQLNKLKTESQIQLKQQTTEDRIRENNAREEKKLEVKMREPVI